MMTNEDRKRVFWLLKKYSSYTAWKAWGDALQKYTDAWEYAVKHAKPPLDSDDFWVEVLKEYWDGCESFDKGLPLLRQGDRYIFKKKGNWRIFDTLNYANKIMDDREYVHDWMVNEADVKQLYKQLDDLGFGPGWVTERTDNYSAALMPDNVFSTHTWPPKLDYAQFNFPSELTEVPAPSTKTIDTGKEIPVDGVWEPEWADPAAFKGVVTNIRNLFTPSVPTNVQKGCMNYLVAGTFAPPYQDGEKRPIIPVRWRLVWEDNRYKDGTIPAEEDEYFAAPSIDTKVSTVGRVEGGKSCSQSGYWLTPAKIDSRRYFKEGEIMPDYQSAYGTTIWQWDTKQG